ncbi:uncharacterized protein BDW70DRAFT_26914 [Aspergillus foveolatus]|uniref:uncharacterized protein n=1 Tax=Aspergillus foveolatus TaxID=210207 RepID=UPI003CCDBD12
MAHHNTATNAASQTNIGVELTLFRRDHYHITAPAIDVAVAQQFGSPLYTRYTCRPLDELIAAVTSNTGILPKRYHGSGIYNSEIGRLMTVEGGIQEIPMAELVAQKHDEQSTPLGTLIICLSVAMSKTALSPILASAIMVYVNGLMEKSMDGTIRIIQGKIEKYASAVIGRDSMCNKLENAKQDILDLVRMRAPHIARHTLFLPPRLSPEEGDFVEFLAQILSANVDGQEIYTRSTKLLGLALLLSHYGWQIDVSVENEAMETVDLVGETKALRVIYSTAGINRHYVENHDRYIRSSRRPFYPTASCMAAQMGQAAAFSLSETENDPGDFMAGYAAAQRFFLNHVKPEVQLTNDGLIAMALHLDVSLDFVLLNRDCQDILRPSFFSAGIPDIVQKVLVYALCNQYPDYDWRLLKADIKKHHYPDSPFTTLLDRFPGDRTMLLAVAGAVLGVLDQIIVPLVNLPDNSRIRIPAGQGLLDFITGSLRYLEDLLSTGLEPGSAVVLCSTKLAGVNPRNPRMPAGSDTRAIVGHWNAQQGILLTPIYERSLYSDLPSGRSRPLTLYNTPILGIPTDEGGWIKPGIVDNPISRRLPTFPKISPGPCKVIIEYRPHFEVDSNSVVAAVYLDGVYYNLMALTRTLSPRWYHVSRCTHPVETELVPGIKGHIALRNLEPGELVIPRGGDHDRPLLVGPQIDRVSRFFSTTVYHSFRPVVQSGCLRCAVDLTEKTQSLFVIPRQDLQVTRQGI